MDTYILDESKPNFAVKLTQYTALIVLLSILSAIITVVSVYPDIYSFIDFGIVYLPLLIITLAISQIVINRYKKLYNHSITISKDGVTILGMIYDHKNKVVKQLPNDITKTFILWKDVKSIEWGNAIRRRNLLNSKMESFAVIKNQPRYFLEGYVKYLDKRIVGLLTKKGESYPLLLAGSRYGELYKIVKKCAPHNVDVNIDRSIWSSLWYQTYYFEKLRFIFVYLLGLCAISLNGWILFQVLIELGII